MQLDALRIPADYLHSVVDNLQYNKRIGEYYERLMLEAGVNRKAIEDKLERLQLCNKFWQLDKYELSKVKDFIKTNLCKDKFCNNCKKVKQASRMARFMPEIREASRNHKISQLVLTCPNVPGEQLAETIEKLFRSMARLIEFLKGKKKIKGIDFSGFGYRGAIRSLEITFKGDEYHPHLHVLMAHDGEIGEKNRINCYSFDKYDPNSLRMFSDFEILIQKIWFLLMNGIRVTKANIEALEVGYSCMMDEFRDDDFIELFKYMTKATDEEGNLMTYENFRTLYFSLHGVRQIQGYGIFFRIKDDDLEELVDEKYNELIEQLRQKEIPESVHETPQELLESFYLYTIISRKRIYAYIRNLVSGDE